MLKLNLHRRAAAFSPWRRAAESAPPRIAAEFVRLKVDVIVTDGAAFIIAAKQATSVIPIVFAAAASVGIFTTTCRK